MKDPKECKIVKGKNKKKISFPPKKHLEKHSHRLVQRQLYMFVNPMSHISCQYLMISRSLPLGLLLRIPFEGRYRHRGSSALSM